MRGINTDANPTPSWTIELDYKIYHELNTKGAHTYCDVFMLE